jgi:hypothetical protein
MYSEKQAVSNSNMETLEQIVCDPGRGKSLVGVVIDATGIYIANNSLDFVTRVRIIDETFNYKQALPQELNLVPYIELFFYSS